MEEEPDPQQSEIEALREENRVLKVKLTGLESQMEAIKRKEEERMKQVKLDMMAVERLREMHQKKDLEVLQKIKQFNRSIELAFVPCRPVRPTTGHSPSARLLDRSTSCIETGTEANHWSTPSDVTATPDHVTGSWSSILSVLPVKATENDKRTPKGTTKDTKKNTPRDRSASKDTHKDTAKNTLDDRRGSKSSRKDTPKDKLKDIAKNTARDTTKDTLKDTPQNTPNCIAKNTSKDRPKSAPKFTPKDSVIHSEKVSKFGQNDGSSLRESQGHRTPSYVRTRSTLAATGRVSEAIERLEKKNSAANRLTKINDCAKAGRKSSQTVLVNLVSSGKQLSQHEDSGVNGNGAPYSKTAGYSSADSAARSSEEGCTRVGSMEIVSDEPLTVMAEQWRCVCASGFSPCEASMPVQHLKVTDGIVGVAPTVPTADLTGPAVAKRSSTAGNAPVSLEPLRAPQRAGHPSTNASVASKTATFDTAHSKVMLRSRYQQAELAHSRGSLSAVRSTRLSLTPVRPTRGLCVGGNGVASSTPKGKESLVDAAETGPKEAVKHDRVKNVDFEQNLKWLPVH